MTNLTQGIAQDQVDAHKALLTPEANKSHFTDLYGKVDHLDMKRTYNQETTSKWQTAGKVALLIGEFIATVVMNLVKYALTPLAIVVLPPISKYQNNKIAAANLNFEDKAVAFVKAAKEHFGHGSLQTAIAQNANQSGVVEMNASLLNAQGNVNRNTLSLAQTNHNLIQAAQDWANAVQGKASASLTDVDRATRMNFFMVAVSELTQAEGANPAHQANLVTDAKIAIAQAYKTTTVEALRTTGAVTTREVTDIINDYLSFMPATADRVAIGTAIANEIASDPTIQGSAVTRRAALLTEISDLRSMDAVRVATDARLTTNESRISVIDVQINQVEREILEAQNTVGAILSGADDAIGGMNRHAYFTAVRTGADVQTTLKTNIDKLFGTRDHEAATRQAYVEVDVVRHEVGRTPQPDNQPIYAYDVNHNAVGQCAALSTNDAGLVVNAGLVAKLDALRAERVEKVAEVRDIVATVRQEAQEREEGVVNAEGNITRRGVPQVKAELLSLAAVFADQPQVGNVATVRAGLEDATANLDADLLNEAQYHGINRAALTARDARTETQKLTALQKAANTRSQTVYTLVHNEQMTAAERLELHRKMAHEIFGDASQHAEGTRQADPAFIFDGRQAHTDGMLSGLMTSAITNRQADIARAVA